MTDLIQRPVYPWNDENRIFSFISWRCFIRKHGVSARFEVLSKRSIVRAKKIHSGKMNTAIMGFEIALKV
jgi:hypothetical protein